MASSKPFNAKPENIRKVRLSPTDRTIFSTKPNLFNFRMFRKRKPGIKVKKIKLEICLRMGISRRMAILVTAIIAIIKLNHLVGDRFIPCSAIFYPFPAT